jgi:hypothetical protein
MHWEVVEVLTLIAGVITIGGWLVVPEVEQSTRLKGAAVGVASILYALYAAGQSTGIIIVPVGAWAAAAVTLYFAYISFAGEQEDSA